MNADNVSKHGRHRTGRWLTSAAAMALGAFLASTGAETRSQSGREPVTLTFLDAELSVPELLLKPDPDLQEFTRQTGIRVRHVPGPEGSLNQLTLWQESLRSGASTPDVYSIDVIWPGILGQYFLDLKAPLASDLAAYDAAAVAAFTVNGRVVAVPYRPHVGVLVYRRDLLQRYGYTAPPRTWAELDAMASRIQEGERTRGARDFWGFVWQGAATEGLTCNALEWQVAEGGGRIIEDNGTVSVNNPRAIRAWQRAARWVGRISPPGVVAYQEWDAANVWAAGNAAFMRSWESERFMRRWPEAFENTIGGQPMGDKLGITSVPGGESDGAGALGGFGLAVSQSSAHPREALELVRFLARREVARRATPMPASGPELYELPSILGLSHRRGGGARLSNDVVARPSAVTGPKYEAVTRAFIRSVHAVLTGTTSAPAAAAALEEELVILTGFAKGPPLAR